MPGAHSCWSSTRVGRSHVDTGDRFGRHDNPSDRGGDCATASRTRDRNIRHWRKTAARPSGTAPARVRARSRVALIRDSRGSVDPSEHGVVGAPASHRNSTTAMRIARPIPGMAPNMATPTKQRTESQNSHFWIRKMRRSSANSNSPIAEAITTAASALVGKLCSRLGATSNNSATAAAPTTPVSWVFDPALRRPACATNCC